MANYSPLPGFVWPVIFTFFNDGGRGEKECFMAHENSMKFNFHCPQIKAYWEIAMFICLYDDSVFV